MPTDPNYRDEHGGWVYDDDEEDYDESFADDEDDDPPPQSGMGRDEQIPF